MRKIQAGHFHNAAYGVHRGIGKHTHPAHAVAYKALGLFRAYGPWAVRGKNKTGIVKTRGFNLL